MGDQMEKRKRRADYTGTCAKLPWAVRIGNNSDPVNNDEILSNARETRKEFYDDAFKVIAEISAARNK